MLFQKLVAVGANQGITLVGSKTFSFTGPIGSGFVSLTDLGGGINSAPSGGDFVLVFLGVATDGATAAPTMSVSGYTNDGSTLFGNGTYEASLLTSYKFMPSTPDTSFNISVSGTNFVQGEDPVVGAVFVFRNVNATTPLDVASTTYTGGASVKPTSITPTTLGAMVVVGGVGAHVRGVQAFSASGYVGFISAGAASVNDGTIGGGFIPNASGLTSPATWILSGTSGSGEYFASRTMALRPA